MKDNDTNFEQFEALLKEKGFGDLSEKEREFVKEFCDSAQEYGLMQKMIFAQAPAITSTILTPQNLLDRVAKKAQPSGYQRFVSFKVPFGIYLLSLFTVFGLTYFLKPNRIEVIKTIKEVPREIIKEVPKEVIKIDTIVQFAYRVDTFYLKEKKVTKEMVKTPAPVAIVNNPSKKTLSKKNKHSKGRTIKQDADLKVFFTDIR